MTDERNDKILSLIERLSQEIALARELALTQTAQILAVAQLDLKTVVHGISDQELRAFTALVAEGEDGDATQRRAASIEL